MEQLVQPNGIKLKIMKNVITFFAHLKELGFDVVLFVAGIAGGIAFLTKSDKLTRWQKFSSVLAGGFSANYLTPVVADWISASDKAMNGLAFLIGYGGLKFVESLYLYFYSKFANNTGADGGAVT